MRAWYWSVILLLLAVVTAALAWREGALAVDGLTVRLLNPADSADAEGFRDAGVDPVGRDAAERPVVEEIDLDSPVAQVDERRIITMGLSVTGESALVFERRMRDHTLMQLVQLPPGIYDTRLTMMRRGKENVAGTACRVVSANGGESFLVATAEYGVPSGTLHCVVDASDALHRVPVHISYRWW